MQASFFLFTAYKEEQSRQRSIGRNREMSPPTAPTSQLTGGFKEGVARALSQACTYGMDLQKTFLQVHGRTLNFTHLLQVLQKGMLQSSLTSGMVYSSYFSVYHALSPHPLASTVAALSSSVVKIPISNSMRVMQTQPKLNNFIEAGNKIHRHHGFQGLYTGYGMSLAEDVIEMDLRMRFYQSTTKLLEPILPPGPQRGLLIGALSGGAAAAVTTPFDTIRALLAVQSASSSSAKACAIRTTQVFLQKHGPNALFRGYEYRAVATGMKMALFYMFMEIL